MNFDDAMVILALSLTAAAVWQVTENVKLRLRLRRLERESERDDEQEDPR